MTGSVPLPARRWTARGLHREARNLFPTGPKLIRMLQHYRPFIAPFEEIIPLIPHGVRVLDVGCGGGLWIGLLAATGKLSGGGQAIGFDSSRQAIALAQQMRLPPDTGPRVRFDHLDVRAPWPEGTFDVVCLLDVLHHVPPEAQSGVIRQAAAKVSPGGLFIYKDMCRRPRWRALANRLHDLALAHQWIHYAPVEQVSRWAVGEGLRLEHAASFARWWYGHELRVFRRT